MDSPPDKDRHLAIVPLFPLVLVPAQTELMRASMPRRVLLQVQHMRNDANEFHDLGCGHDQKDRVGLSSVAIA